MVIVSVLSVFFCVGLEPVSVWFVCVCSSLYDFVLELAFQFLSVFNTCSSV